ncbi:MAG: hypothetical protein LBL55_09215 [Propionibacteriaceae bacterium]|jgi:hypothetical protein|nr:hypothetical protein [Propionibacteriaceae bacterium]
MATQKTDWSEADLAAAQAVLGLMEADRAISAGALSDEQIMVLDGPELAQVVEMPWLAEHGGDQPSRLGEVALRGLVTRGEASVEVADGEIVAVTAGPAIAGLLVLRRRARAVLRVGRATADDALSVYCYLQPGGQVLEEVVDVNGFHQFTVLPPDLLGSRLADFIDPNRQAGLGRLERLGSLRDFLTLSASLPELSQAVAVSTITAAVGPGDPGRSSTIYAGPRGVYWLRQQADDSEPPESEAAVFQLSPLERDGLVRLPLDLLG